jgi:hypothetical protein
MTTRRPGGAPEWPDGWEAHREAQRARVLATTTPAERLAWLEEMIVVAHRTGALPRPRRPWDERDPEPRRGR